MKNELNYNHPERRENEVYLTNATFRGFASFGWTTKRIGEYAYDIYGKCVPFFHHNEHIYPVFVSRDEYLSFCKDNNYTPDPQFPNAYALKEN